MAGDPLWYYKVLGLHCDGANNSTTFTDVKGKTVTAVGNAKISTAQYPALTGKTSSGYIDGTGDYLTVPDSTDWDFGTSGFGLRIRVRFSGVTTVQALISNYLNTTTGFSMVFDGVNSKLQFLNGTTALLDVAWSPSVDTWYTVEVSRQGDSLRGFANGTQLGSTATDSTSITGSTATLFIGARDASNQLLTGYFSEVEVYKYVPINTASYTPSSDPFPDEYTYVSGTVKDDAGDFDARLVRVYHRDSGSFVGEVVSNATTGVWKVTTTKAGNYVAVSLPAERQAVFGKRMAIPFSGANNSIEIVDLFGSDPRAGGDLKIVTTQADPFGGYSGVASFGISGGVAIHRISELLGSAGDFHIRMWIYPTSFPAWALLFYAGNNSYQWARNGAANLSIAKASVSWYFAASSNPTLNTWTYVQLRRSGTSLAIYYDSTSVGSATNSVTYESPGNNLTSGSALFGNWAGYACDFEVLPYADSVTPPTTRLTRFPDVTENALIYDNITPH